MTDTWIAAREALLNRILGIRPDAVLNAPPPERGPQDASDDATIAAELKRAVNGLKATAITPDGEGVDYARLRDSEAYAAYRACTTRLHCFDPATLTTREERLAFWINLYNALVIDAVIGFGVRDSVTDGFLGVMKFFRRAAYNVGGHRLSCDDIEHGILRGNRGHIALPGPQFGPSDPRRTWVVTPPDPRIHFALNCASRSCPPISFYDAERLDAQLDLAAQSFVAGEVTVDPAGWKVCLSRIFQWYRGDFGGEAGVIAFLLAHLADDEQRAWLEAHQADAQLVYERYDWGLNATRTSA